MADTTGGLGPDGGSAASDDVVSLEPEPTQEPGEEPEEPGEEPEEPGEEPEEPPAPAVEPAVHPSLW